MKLFGTDGIRGKFNEPPIDHVQLVKIGYAFAKSLFGNEEGKVYISHDGRESSSDIESALIIGIMHQGSKVISVGLLPTPALSICLNTQRLTEELCAGIQITASHNPYHDNGVKFFNKNGFKIDSVLEEIIENNYFSQKEEIGAKNQKKPKSDYAENFNKRYIDYINKTIFQYFINNFRCSSISTVH